MTAVSKAAAPVYAAACIVCGAPAPVPVLEVPHVVVETSRLWKSREYAESAQTRVIHLAFCASCGHVFNLSFDRTAVVYDGNYEASQMFSPKFRDYAVGLARALVDSYGLFGKHVIEIGGGKGDFLRLICKSGDNQGTNIDPGAPVTDLDDLGDITHVAEYYGDHHSGLAGDLYCTRHTLEHVWDPAEFVRRLRRAIGRRRIPVYIEVPSMNYVIRDDAIFELIYPHCSYFTRHSLTRLCSNAGFEVLQLREEFDGQFLGAWLIPRTGTGSSSIYVAEVEDLSEAVRQFAQRFRAKVRAMQMKLERCARNHRRVVMWGAGAKAVTFTNLADRGKQIEYLVDLNPRKVGTYMPKTAQAIVDPAFLREYRPDVVMVTNPVYEDEIRHSLEDLGVRADIEFV